jgi:hypothetical protein
MDTDDTISKEDEEPPPKARNSRYDKHYKARLRCFGGVWHRLYAVASDDVEATRIKNSIKKGPNEHVKIIKENDYRLVYYGDEYMFKPRPKNCIH